MIAIYDMSMNHSVNYSCKNQTGCNNKFFFKNNMLSKTPI